MLLLHFHLICLVIVTFTIYLDTVKELQKWQDEAEYWKSQPSICHTTDNGDSEISIELCKAIGKQSVLLPGNKYHSLNFKIDLPIIMEFRAINLTLRSLKVKIQWMIS